jgi:hypothetical protein
MAVVRSRYHVLSRAPCLGWKEWLGLGQDLISFLSLSSLSERGNRAAHRNIRPSLTLVPRQEDKVPLISTPTRATGTSLGLECPRYSSLRRRDWPQLNLPS